MGQRWRHGAWRDPGLRDTAGHYGRGYGADRHRGPRQVSAHSLATMANFATVTLRHQERGLDPEAFKNDAHPHTSTRFVLLVHGYNTSAADAVEGFDAFRDTLVAWRSTLRAELVYVQWPGNWFV